MVVLLCVISVLMHAGSQARKRRCGMSLILTKSGRGRRISHRHHLRQVVSVDVLK